MHPKHVTFDNGTECFVLTAYHHGVVGRHCAWLASAQESTVLVALLSVNIASCIDKITKDQLYIYMLALCHH